MNETNADAEFLQDLAALLNRHSLENGSNTPDFVLARHRLCCLDAFNEGVANREAWYGHSHGPERPPQTQAYSRRQAPPEECQQPQGESDIFLRDGGIWADELCDVFPLFRERRQALRVWFERALQAGYDQAKREAAEAPQETETGPTLENRVKDLADRLATLEEKVGPWSHIHPGQHHIHGEDE